MLEAHDEKTVMSTAAKLKKYRLERNLKQVEVAEKANLNSNYYAKVERGEAVVSILTLEKICKALKVKSSDILPF